jgi:hypothetical protein
MASRAMSPRSAAHIKSIREKSRCWARLGIAAAPPIGTLWLDPSAIIGTLGIGLAGMPGVPGVGSGSLPFPLPPDPGLRDL